MKQNLISIDTTHTFVTTPYVTTAESVVNVNTRILNASSKNICIRIVASIKESNGTIIGEALALGQLMAYDYDDFRVEFAPKPFKLWSEEHPIEYNCSMTLYADDIEMDCFNQSFIIC